MSESDTAEEFRTRYVETLKLIERLHRQLLDVIKAELETAGRADINAVQALLLFNIGGSEMTAGELRTRGHYVGSNVSYNLKKLVEGGYIHHVRSEQDRRSVRVSLTDKGFEVEKLVADLFQRHVEDLQGKTGLTIEAFNGLASTCYALERFWTDQIRFSF